MPNELVTSILRELNASSVDIEASALISTDGLLVASLLPAEFEHDRVAAMSAAMLALGSQATMELNRGALDQILIKGQRGHVLLTRASPKAVLVVITRPEAKLGTTFLDVRRGAEAWPRPSERYVAGGPDERSGRAVRRLCGPPHHEGAGDYEWTAMGRTGRSARRRARTPEGTRRAAGSPHRRPQRSRWRARGTTTRRPTARRRFATKRRSRSSGTTPAGSCRGWSPAHGARLRTAARPCTSRALGRRSPSIPTASPPSWSEARTASGRTPAGRTCPCRRTWCSLPAPFYEVNHPDMVPLDILLWKLALGASRGRLPLGTSLDTPVALREWPNFTRLVVTPGAMSVAALWARQTCTLGQTIHLLGLPPADVFAFYSAAAAIDLVRPELPSQPAPATRPAISPAAPTHPSPPPSPPPPAITPAPRRNLLRKVFDKLRTT